MPLPPLTNWDKTRQSLHRAAQVLAAFRKVGVERDPEFFRHLSLQVVSDGITTGVTNFGEIKLYLKTQYVLFLPPVRDETQGLLSLIEEEYSQVTLADRLLRLLKRFNQPIQPDLSALTDETPFEIDPQASMDYGQVLFTVYQAMQAVWSEFPGNKLPPVVFPHGFDLSCLWFTGRAESEEDPHMNFGFSPRSAGLERPYFYSYAYPIPSGYFEMRLPPLMRFQREGWNGTVLPYDELIKTPDPVKALQDAMRQIQQSTAALMK